jgi:hypothetical protein
MIVTKFIRWTYEICACLYWSLLFRARASLTGGNWLLDKIDRAVIQDRYRTTHFLSGVFHADVQLFHVEWFAVTAIAFACVRLLSQVKLVDRAVPVVGLCLTLAGPLYFSPGVSPEWGDSPPRVLLLCLEIVVMMVILIRYGRRISITTAGLCLVAVLANFCLWGWVMMSEFNHAYAWQTLLSYLILPLCTVLLWGLYARMASSEECLNLGSPKARHLQSEQRF